jgi:hypothetical protein
MDWSCFKYDAIWVSFDIHQIKGTKLYVNFNGLNLIIFDEIYQMTLKLY